MTMTIRKSLATLFMVTSLISAILWTLSFSDRREIDFRWSAASSQDDLSLAKPRAVISLVSYDGQLMVQQGYEWTANTNQPWVTYGSARFRAATSGTSDLSRAGFETYSSATEMGDSGVIFPYWFVLFVLVAGFMIAREPSQNPRREAAARAGMGF